MTSRILTMPILPMPIVPMARPRIVRATALPGQWIGAWDPERFMARLGLLYPRRHLKSLPGQLRDLSVLWMSKVNTWENDVLTWLIRPATTAPTRPTDPVHVGLWTADPGEAGTASTELAGANGYARQSMAFDAPASGATQNSAAATHGPATGSDWSQATHFAVCDNVARGTADLIYKGALAVARTALVNQSIQWATADLDVSED